MILYRLFDALWLNANISLRGSCAAMLKEFCAITKYGVRELPDAVLFMLQEHSDKYHGEAALGHTCGSSSLSRARRRSSPVRRSEGRPEAA